MVPATSPWLDEGRDLLEQIRQELQASHKVIVTEPWWGEEPAA